MTETTLTQLPEGCECRLDFYLISDEADAEVRVGLEGMTSVPATGEALPEPLKLVASLGAVVDALADGASDWRFMSRAEIADYKDRNPAA